MIKKPAIILLNNFCVKLWLPIQPTEDTGVLTLILIRWTLLAVTVEMLFSALKAQLKSKDMNTIHRKKTVTVMMPKI